jgi:hypothetical protein
MERGGGGDVGRNRQDAKNAKKETTETQRHREGGREQIAESKYQRTEADGFPVP